MDPTEILVVRFHYGGEFVRIGPNLDYVGGDDALSEIERDKLSLQEVIGFVKDHIEYKQTMKIYFQIPGKELWPVSSNPRPQAPGYVRMPGRPKKNNRKREETEKPKAKKMSKHGTIMKCSLCGIPGHNKSSCAKNPERGKKKNVHLSKTAHGTSDSREGAKRGKSKKPAESATPTARASGPPPPITRASGPPAQPAKASVPAPTARNASAPPAASRFKPPRKRTATSEAGPSGSRGRAKRGRRNVEDIPSYSYFTCSGKF